MEKKNTYDIWITSENDERTEDRHQSYSIDGIIATNESEAIALGLKEFKDRHGNHKHIERVSAYLHKIKK